MSGKGFFTPIFKFLRIDKIKKLSLSEKKLEEFESRLIKFYKEDKVDFLFTLLISLLSWIFMFLEFKFALLILGYDVSFTTIFLIFSFVGAAMVFPIPMGLGSLEAGQILVFSLIELRTAAGVALAFIVRVRDLAWTAIGMLLLSYYGIKISNTIKKGYVNDKL
jgi:uncharacterized protein (TIRG00374 family)